MLRPAFSRLLDPVERASLLGAAGTLIAMALVQFWQVFARYVLNASPGWTEPVALVLMSLAVMLGSAVAVRQEMHFRFAMVAEGGTPARQRLLAQFARLVAAGSGLLMALLGGRLMLDDWHVQMAGAPLPLGMRFLGLTVGGVLILLFAAERLLGGAPLPVSEEEVD
ncbi:TRAP transporter small permease [Sandaracinobacteroides hominis]|uniref:TRAP transporter small permease n=1 Tax=Sandaracinobacteroides hominis TaxID=2780086 RepID=UPI0018F30DDE|nr:TRAP transporter small permease [Sandaracinobacteroides hominis]